jgi:chromate transporter
MNGTEREVGRRRLSEVVSAFLKLGLTAYGGPAIMGIMQAELQEKRRWVTRERFVEGVALVNMLPGATATQLGIFLGYMRGGWWGGLLAGLCFVLPGFAIMLALSLGYTVFGATPLMTGVLYGMGPVVLGIFFMAVYRMGQSAAATSPQLAIAAAAAAASAFSPLSIVPILVLAGGLGLALFHSRRLGVAVLVIVAALIGAAYLAPWPWGALAALGGSAGAPGEAPALSRIGAFFVMVGAFSFGGGMTLIAFIQDQVVNQHQWLTHQEFIDGLVLGQFTPGPILMVAAYVGYKVAGVAGAAVAGAAIFLPAFVLMLSLLPMYERARKLIWTKAAMKGIGPAAVGVLAVSLVQLAPHAMPDAMAVAIFAAVVIASLVWRIGPFKLVVLGAAFGALRNRLGSV